VKIKIPSEWEKFCGHKLIIGDSVISSKLNSRTTVLGDCIVKEDIPIVNHLDVGGNLTLKKNSAVYDVGSVNVAKDLDAFDAEIMGECIVGGKFYSNGEISGNVAAQTIDLWGRLVKKGTLNAEVINVWGLARIDGYSDVIAHEANLYGEISGHSNIISETVNLIRCTASEDAEIFCKRIDKISGIKDFKGKIYTESCPDDFYQKYHDLIVIKDSGWFDNYVKERGVQIAA